MTIIVAGKLTIKPGSRDEFIEKSREAILQARKNEDCEDFSVSPDPIDFDRVNIFEKWNDFNHDNDQNLGSTTLTPAFDLTTYPLFLSTE